MNTQVQSVPNGMMLNPKGGFDPISTVEDIDIARDSTVIEVADMAKHLHAEMGAYKQKMLNEIKAFVDLSLEMYGVKQGGKKGNITLLSYDAKYKIQIAQQDNITFDERLQGAKELIDECVVEWSDGSDDKIKVLVNHAFEVDKEGNISTGRILSLRKLKIKDAKWKRAMEAISDSIQVVMTKEYIRVYERDGKGKYHQIALDFAGL